MDLLISLFQHGHWIIGLTVVVVIALIVINNGGGMFDFLDGNARYDNRWTNFEFNVMAWAFPVVIIGGIIWLLIVVLKPDDPPVSPTPARSRPEVSKTKSAPKKTTKSHSHKHPAHPAH
jgi:hypothetical protein